MNSSETHDNNQLFTLGRDIRRSADHAPVSFAEIEDIIKTGRSESIKIDIRVSIALIRNQSLNEKLRKSHKERLPWFSGSLFRGSRSNQNVCQINYIILDLDHVEFCEQVKDMAIRFFPYVLMAFTSPSGRGVKLVCKLSRPIIDKGEYKDVWNLLVNEIEVKLGIRADISCKDPARVHFLSHDPHAIIGKGIDGVDVENAIYVQKAGNIEPELPHTPDISSFELGMEADEDLEFTNDKSTRSDAEPIPPYRSAPEFDYETNWQEAISLVEKLAKQKIAYRDWIRIAFSLKNVFGDRALPLWLQFANNSNYPDDTEKSLRKIWNSIPNHNNVNMGTLIFLGGKYGCQ